MISPEDTQANDAAQELPLLVHFLEKIITADTAPLLSGRAIYSALLTANGKYIADFFITPMTNRLLIETDKAVAPTLMAQLQRYILRQPIKAEPLTMAVAVTFDNPADNSLAEDVFVVTDPRPANQTCYRLYGAIEKNSLAQTAYVQWRIDNLLPEGVQDFEQNESLVVEYHLQTIGGLSLKKGCFVGQEVTARIYYKQAMVQKLKKKLVKKIMAKDAVMPDEKILSSVIIGDKKHALVLEKNRG